MAATAMIDRLIHHSEILSLKFYSYRLRGKDLDARIGAKAQKSPDRSPSPCSPRAADGLRTRRSSTTVPARTRRRQFAPLAYGSLREPPPLTDTHVVHVSAGASGPLFNRP
jgi:hypothetical protein